MRKFLPFTSHPIVAPITIAASSPVNRYNQQSISGFATITVAGTYSGGTPDSITARAVPTGSTGVDTGVVNISVKPTGGVYSGTITIARGGWYSLTVTANKSNQAAGTALVNRFGSGDIFITCGQSTAANSGSPAQVPTSDLVGSLDLSGNIYTGDDPQPVATGTAGSPWPSFASAVAVHTGCPVSTLSTAIGSTLIAQWVPGQTDYTTNIHPAVTLFPPKGFRAFLWQQGEQDAGGSDGESGMTTQASYEASGRSIFSQIRTDAGWTVPVGVCNTTTYEEGMLPNNYAAIQAAQEVLATDANNFVGANSDSLTGNTYRLTSDHTHMNALGLYTNGTLWATCVINAMGL